MRNENIKEILKKLNHYDYTEVAMYIEKLERENTGLKTQVEHLKEKMEKAYRSIR